MKGEDRGEIYVYWLKDVRLKSYLSYVLHWKIPVHGMTAHDSYSYLLTGAGCDAAYGELC